MVERLDGLSPQVLAKQLSNERTRREKLEAEVLAFKAALAAGEAPEILVDVAAVILEAQAAMNTAGGAAPLGDRVSTGRPGSREPQRNRRPSVAFRRFKARVDGAVNGWSVEKERDFEPIPRDPEESARVWCCRKACSQHQISLPKYARSKKLGWVELAPVCNGRVEAEMCGWTMVDRP